MHFHPFWLTQQVLAQVNALKELGDERKLRSKAGLYWPVCFVIAYAALI
jgi:hypothetical protein